MASQLNSANDDLVLNTTGGSDLVFQQDGVEKGRVGAGGFGKVLQVQSTKHEATASSSTTSLTYIDTGLIVTITPESINSKIRIEVSCAGQMGNSWGSFSISKNGVNLSNSTHGLGLVGVTSATNYFSYSGVIIDDNITDLSAITYELIVKSDASTFTYFSNDTDSIIIATEIGA